MTTATDDDVPGSDEVDPVVHDGFAELAVGRREAASGERVDLAGRRRTAAAAGDERRAECEGEVVVEPGAA